MFVDGFLGLCSAVGAGTATELAVAGYARQPIGFGEPENGIAFSTVPYTFGQAVRWIIMGNQVFPTPAGRAIFDAPTGGNLLLVLPFSPTRGAGRVPWDEGDPGYLRLDFTALHGFRKGGAYTGQIAAGAVAGLCSDRDDVVTMHDITQVPGQERPLINTATMTAGVALSLRRGVLAAA